MSEEFEKRGDRRVQQLVIDIGPDPEELPHLPVLERDFQNTRARVITERLHLGVEDFHGWDLQRRYEVRAILHLLSTLSAKHHGAKNLAVLYTEHIYGISSILF